MTQFFAQVAGNPAPAAGGAGPRTQPEAVYERFQKMNPQKFSGTTNPMVAEEWVKSIEVIFEYMELQDVDRVRCAIFLLAGDARRWWDSASVAVNLPMLSWDGFKEMFFAKYFTEEVQARLTTEFMTLRQGDSSVAEFVRKFEQGCYFVPLIANDARAKLRHFMGGLRPVLRRDVRVTGLTTYAAVVSGALAAEQDQRDIETDMLGKRPYQAPPQPQHQHQRPQYKKPFQGQPGKKPYQGPPRGKGPIQQQGAPQRPVVFPMCPKCNRQHPGPCLYGSGEELLATSVVRDIDLELQGHLVYADLIILPMPEFDIILGMDWLTKNRARRLISKGCQAFLASIVSAPDVTTPSISDVPVVRDFPDVFPDDVAGLPPDREVEFAIDLLPAQRSLQYEIQRFDLEVYRKGKAPKLSNLTVKSSLLDRIRAGQSSDEQLQKWRLKDEAKGSVLYTVSDGWVFLSTNRQIGNALNAPVMITHVEILDEIF
ncbi:uncharacterized protein LOC142528468 [Primulina tabacum]|uniref:uncharacterized protein LOC142528468 n=1 Tax=Primulina tabacum TaxID=48773 RepID=UPI003F59F518